MADDPTVIVTADHGETFGQWRDYRLYGHPNRCHVSPLVTVPFVTVEPAESPARAAESDSEKLEALGYVE